MTLLLVLLLAAGFSVGAQPERAQLAASEQPRLVTVADGWAKNSINAVIFRRNSIVSHKDTQIVAFYDPTCTVVLARRKLGSAKWEVRTTGLKGNCADAHNSISIMIDGDGVLHIAWNHHGTPLRYARSAASGSLDLTDPMPMTGQNESQVTYPEFYRLPDGSLLFANRDGASGRGNLVLNRYDTKAKKWTQLQNNLISGEGRRNPYWQMTVDQSGTVHLSWVWRESPDVASNHDLCYAKSLDGGKTWRKSDGQVYALPITAATAEYAWKIREKSELINQTSMTADARGRPYIATYWRPEGNTVPQYMVVYHDGSSWRKTQVTMRTTAFTLSGGGTKRIPISRPQILAETAGGKMKAYVIFRDQERGNRVSVAVSDDLARGRWQIHDLTRDSVEMWEPSYDTELWARSRVLHLFVQKVGQGDSETMENMPPQPVSILEWKPKLP
jgi:hypothetical protein